ncbi:dynamin family protein [Phytohabitans rumicis]|uniref:Isoniazid inducible gene protein IniA n=1 Tax=Phytohabitans rumicis TaxID=1076125 RepID=A0A6V8L2G5_9ACTN|nr:dynamin family protein [Phytohabitans rumicis]GFJ91483.1 isoniazid inducible gene protein IniA [Phytohabitans rumicis]
MAPIWLDVLDETARVCASLGRTDLVHRLLQKRAQLLDPTLRVLVIGEPKQGKSQLINALINAPVCPVGDGITTAIPTVVRHAETPSAALVPAGDAEERIAMPVADIASRISSGSGRWSGADPGHAEIGVPRGLLASGIVLIDTPGTDERHSVPLPKADLVLLVTDATRELSVTEVDLLLHVMQSHPRVLVALTKTDISPHWRTIAERNREHLASAGVPATLLPVSAALRLQAARTNDKAINAESGFPELIARLTRDLGTKKDVLAPSTVGLLATTVIEQLAAPLRAELSTEDSGSISRLYDAQRGLDELRRCSTRWQNTLADEMTDLMSDIEYDLRDRTRQIMRKVDEAFETADPLKAWDEYQSWMEKNLTEATEANFAWLVQRCDWVTGRVADHFVRYGADILPEWRHGVPDRLAEQLNELERPNIEKFTPAQKIFTGLRGSYGGLLMFGLATTLAGMPLINPVSLGAGALFGGKSIRDEGRSMLKRRQATAKLASQRHVDDFFLRLNKECKDTARWVQRALRDHFTGLTEQLQEAIVHSLRTAKQAADADALERDQRHRDIQQKMRRLAALYDRAQTLSTLPRTLEPVA